MGLLILAITIVPMVTAYTIYKTGIGIPTDTVNKGELLLPATSVKSTNFYDYEQNKVDLLSLSRQKKWRVIIPGNAECSSDCQEILYLTRQVHIRLGEKANRVERIYINSDRFIESGTDIFFRKEHPKLKHIHLGRESWQQWLGHTNISVNSMLEKKYFLVDQEGFVMMFYGVEHSGKDLLSDLKRLLKYSYED